MNELKWYTETKGWKNWTDLPYWAKYEILKSAAVNYERFIEVTDVWPEATNVLVACFIRARTANFFVPISDYDPAVVEYLKHVCAYIWEGEGIGSAGKIDDYGFSREVYTHASCWVRFAYL